MKAEIITIGDEILIGQIVDTNSAWMARQLNATGIEIFRIVSVRDQHDQILQALKDAEGRADLVLITGGLGPTRDDITRGCLCDFFHTRLVFHPPTFEHISRRFAKRGIPLNTLNRDQALVPESCTVIPNENGTAPGMWFEQNDTLFISMPGVPFEMKEMMVSGILPRLAATGKTRAIVHKTVLTQGVPESLLAERISAWEDGLPAHISLAYLPNPMAVRLRLTARGDSRDILADDIDQQILKLLPLIRDCFFGFDEETLAMATGHLLLAKNATLTVAESCTGGYLSHLITLTPGCSQWYNGGITAYSNAAKTNLLGVSPQTIALHGAVSRETALEMARGAKNALHAGYAIATTGIAGPAGGTPEKPVGTLWIAIAGPAKFICENFVFGNDRERNISRASQTALQLLRKLLLED